MKHLLKQTICIVVTFLIVATMLSATASYSAENSIDNRFNVMIVLDASGSMKKTDPENLRFEAITQFVNLLAERGNYLGCIVFSTKISAQQDPSSVNSLQDKNQVLQTLRSVPSAGWTNTGEALLAAVDTLTENGDPTLPSVILLLSDGNTEMGNKDETATSLDLKANAIQKARENDISIYSVCLNADKSADVAEMAQISNATGGVFQEVGSALDLGDVFNAFYNLIYGTSTIILADDVFPDSGILEKTFQIPGIGVEEVNIIIYGKTSNLALFKPDGTEAKASSTELNSMIMLKVTDIVPGTWKIITTGIPGDRIKVNMVYNTDLGIDVMLPAGKIVIDENTPVNISASLRSGKVVAGSREQYNGYSAVLHILNVYDEEINTVPMMVVQDHFEVKHVFKEGTYKFRVSVTGNYIDKVSDISGPLTITIKEQDQKIDDVVVEVNTPPEPVKSPVNKTVYIWPFYGCSLDLNLKTLAKDEQDEELRYKIVSSSFIEDTDYTVRDDVLTLNHFSLSKGAFTVRATDTGGLFCDIEVIVVSRNVGIMALIGIGIAALIVLAAVAFVTYRSFGIPFMGSITVENIETNQSATMRKSRGRLKLSNFRIGKSPIGNAYFQASGKNYVYLKTSKSVYADNAFKKSRKIKIDGNMDIKISFDNNFENGILVRFESILNNLY